MNKFKFMSFKKGEGRWGNVAILVAAMALVFRAGKKTTGIATPGVVGTLTATASSTLAGIGKYFAPAGSQNPIVVRKSVGLYSNRG